MIPLNKIERTYVAACIYAHCIPKWYYDKWSGNVWENGKIIARLSTERHDELADMADKIAEIIYD